MYNSFKFYAFWLYAFWLYVIITLASFLTISYYIEDIMWVYTSSLMNNQEWQ